MNDDEKTEELLGKEEISNKFRIPWWLVLLIILAVLVIGALIYLSTSSAITGVEKVEESSSGTEENTNSPKAPKPTNRTDTDHYADMDENSPKFTGLYYTDINQFSVPAILSIGRRGTLIEVFDLDGDLYEFEYSYDWGDEPSTFDCTLQNSMVNGELNPFVDDFFARTMRFHINTAEDELYITNLTYPNSDENMDFLTEDITYLRDPRFTTLEEMTEYYFNKQYTPF